MIEFSLTYALAVIFFSTFLPGAILSFALLKKSCFTFVEKTLIGFAFGWLLQGFLPFAEFLFAGIKFSYHLGLINTGIIYALGIGIFIWSKAYEGFKFKLPDAKAEPMKYVVPAAIILLFFVNFWVRVQTLSPIFQELDPYYYMDVAQQIVNYGYNPLDDRTAWYPDMKVDHRTTPLLAYVEAGWYSFYTGGAGYNNYLLSLVSNIYPAFAAAFAAFFLYLGLRAWYREEYALVSSAVLSFIPIFIMKLASGEAEIQPHAFFALSMFVCFYLWAQKKQDLKHTLMAGAAYFAVSLGSSSEVIAATIMLLFLVLQALTLFVSKRSLETFARLSAVFLIFPVFAALCKSLFVGYPVVSYAAVNLAAFAAVAALYLLQRSKLDTEMQFYVLGGLVIGASLLLAFTPIGGVIKGIALIGLRIAQYNLPLDRTIAEQGTSGAIFEPQLGFLGKIFDHGPYIAIGAIFAIPSALSNLAFVLFSAILNTIFGTNLVFEDRENSVLMALIFFTFIAAAYSAYRLVAKNEETPVWFFIALIFPITLVGLIKAKYIIYLGYVMSAALTFVFGELEMLVAAAAKLFGDSIKSFMNPAGAGRNAFYFFMAIGLATATLQFLDSNAPLLLSSSLQVRFQDNPAALQQKFSSMCDELRLRGASDSDPELAKICEAGKDAVAFADKGINYQYDQTLCALSFMNSLDAQDANARAAAAYRCERITDYWIESMEWVRDHTENDSRITSWWDYGHWENFFGQRNAVIRNEHSSHDMIVEIAHDYISGTPEELKADMIRYDSKYALFDSELLFSGKAFGGKYGALNYLACARNNLTNVSRSPGDSQCELDHLWTTIYVPANAGPQDECTISFNQKGVAAYAIVQSQGGYALDRMYCVGSATLVTGQNVTALYDLRSVNADGSLKLVKGFMKFEYGTQDQRWLIYALVFTHDKVWVENGSVVDGWEDRTSKFYDSNLYNAFVLEELPGFDLVYKTSDGQVKIFKIRE